MDTEGDSSVEFEQDVAQKLFKHGAILVMLNMPLGSEIGIDCNLWNIAEKFRGIKMIPPGVHFVYYSAVGTDGQIAPRTGFFYDFQPQQMLVKKWDKKLEDLQSESVSLQEQQSIESNKKELDRYLGVYPYDSYRKWVSLSSHITPVLLSSLQPLSGRICAAAQFESVQSTTASRRAETIATDSSGLPLMEPIAGTEIRFSDISLRCYPPGATASEVTQHSMDASYSLDRLLTLPSSHSDVLGELQFAFVCFLIAQVYDAFEQWKQLLRLLCSCDHALTTHSDLYTALIPVLHHQLREVPADFFIDVVSADNFLVVTLRSLFSRIAEADVPTALQRRAVGFRNNLERRFRWDFTSQPDDDDECQPVIVELPDDNIASVS